VHDLLDVYGSLNARHFDHGVQARIGWGRRAPGGRRRSIKMGVYLHDHKIIRIHPALDDERVPRHFVEMVVFHEMLHQIFPPSADAAGRRIVHGPDFRAAERRFPGYERARAWEKAHLHLLLRQRS
jgi:predicted metal-dependent hydrolase